MKTIGEVARQIGVSPQTLREWERAGLIPKATRLFPLARWRAWQEGEVKRIRDFASKQASQRATR